MRDSGWCEIEEERFDFIRRVLGSGFSDVKMVRISGGSLILGGLILAVKGDCFTVRGNVGNNVDGFSCSLSDPLLFDRVRGFVSENRFS